MVSNFDDIELTEEEAAEALRLARKRKYALKQEQAYWDKVNKPVEYPKFDYTELRDKVLKENPHYVLDDNNTDIFNKLCAYFSNDPDCQTMFDINPNKGIMLYGPVGCGKTSLMKMFAVNSYRPFVINPIRSIAGEFTLKEGGENALEKYSSLVPAYPQMNFGHELLGRCFDDIGTEEIKKNFGNEVNVFQDILYKVYDNELIGHFHGTTNLGGEEIQSAYGERIRSRMREMFNVLNFSEKSPDRRN